MTINMKNELKYLNIIKINPDKKKKLYNTLQSIKQLNLLNT